MNPKATIRLESLGVYLPETVRTTEELLASCRRRPRWDLERITGIHERRVARGEFALDLAVQAANRALALSRHRAEDLDLIICTSISKHHRQDVYSLEPATATLVRRTVGATNAQSFDIVNACAGMINGIFVMQEMIRCGMIRRGMVVSGEHNMPVAETATREMRHSFDGQIASLTLGDCGAALILDESPDPEIGFRYIDMVCAARYDHFCHSRPSKRGRGGVLITKARGLQRKGNEHFPHYFKQALDRVGWNLDELMHIIPHQVSVRGIENSTRAAERFLGREIPPITRISADRIGNTSTTSHFAVIHQHILNGVIHDHDNMLLVSGASGIVISHAALTLDDLPGRYRKLHDRPQREK